MFDETEETHESFAMMSFSRIQSSHENALYGSDLKHTTLIEMNLRHSRKKRGLNHDWYHGDSLVASVIMSQNQFSELITSMNMGDGIPVTLSYTEKDGRLEAPAFVSVVEKHHDEFKDTAQETAKNVKNLLSSMEEILSGSGTVKKADRSDLIEQAQKVVRDIASNMPYMEKCFAEAMDKVVVDAKGSIEAFYQHRVVEAGLEALDVKPKLIEK